ncbi:MAG: cellulose binding domain-containing protein [Clostridiales bacterium]|nr:cellulose binding domain-containing protein [Clostridiales bacterium]
MKKTLTILLLVLAITTSLIAGTMAYYTVTLDNLVQGEVVAKEFIFVEKAGQQTLSFSDKMAPGETVEWPFTVQNHKDGLVTETDMYYRLTFVVGATDGKQAIAPLTVTVNGEVVTLNDDGTGTLITHSEFKLISPDNQQSEDYRIVLTWPHGENDSAYAGNNFGTTVTVNAVAQQVPFDEVVPGEPGTEIPGGDDDEPGETEPITSDINVVYKITEAWKQGNPDTPGGYEFTYEIDIFNNSDKEIENWVLDFELKDDNLTSSSQSILTKGNDGHYTISNPIEYNKDIPANSGLENKVTGLGTGSGYNHQPIENVYVNGIEASVQFVEYQQTGG